MGIWGLRPQPPEALAFSKKQKNAYLRPKRGTHRMHAMVLKSLRSPLEWTELPDREPAAGEIRVQISACGVCRTDLHVVDGDLPNPRLPVIPGHEIVGRVDAIGSGVDGVRMGERVGIPWLGHTDGDCPYCLAGRENLCDHPLFTGFTR